MHEDNLMRLLIIGVTLFVFIFTVTAIILYYNAAVDISEVVLEDTVDFGKAYELDLEELKGKDIKGVELINIIKNVSSDTDLTIVFSGTEYNIPRDVTGNIREGNIGMIKKAATYKIEDVTINNNDLEIEIKDVTIY